MIIIIIPLLHTHAILFSRESMVISSTNSCKGGGYHRISYAPSHSHKQLSSANSQNIIWVISLIWLSRRIIKNSIGEKNNKSRLSSLPSYYGLKVQPILDIHVFFFSQDIINCFLGQKDEKYMKCGG